MHQDSTIFACESILMPAQTSASTTITIDDVEHIIKMIIIFGMHHNHIDHIDCDAIIYSTLKNQNG
jgi:hypothetical protein